MEQYASFEEDVVGTRIDIKPCSRAYPSPRSGEHAVGVIAIMKMIVTFQANALCLTITAVPAWLVHCQDLFVRADSGAERGNGGEEFGVPIGIDECSIPAHRQPNRCAGAAFLQNAIPLFYRRHEIFFEEHRFPAFATVPNRLSMLATFFAPDRYILDHSAKADEPKAISTS